ncbi:MAG TPA: peptide deformylase [Candidatus Paceibacterota bacterium]|nr:peptide deformylase [Candidatus Paceibacterota bacterium]
MIEIVQNGNSVLRKIAKEVPVAGIVKPKIQKILKDMAEALHSQDDGVAIAAPQIGLPLRIFIVSGRIFEEDFIRGKKPDIETKLIGKNIKYHKDLIFINPIFKKISKDKKLMVEGCLSVRPIYGKVRRATRATIEAHDEHGKKFTKEASGLLAHIFQHETDHLNGILFIDKAKDIHESTPEEEYE